MHDVASATIQPASLSSMAGKARAVSEYVRHRINRYLKENAGRGAQSELATLVGMKAQSLGMIRDGIRQVGRDAEEGFARVFAGNSIDRLRADAAKWWSEQPESAGPGPGPRIEYDERYPNRVKAAMAARALGVSEAAIKAVESMSLKAATDPDPRTWLNWMEGRDRELEYAEKGPIKPPVLVLGPDEEDPTKPKLPKRVKK